MSWPGSPGTYPASPKNEWGQTWHAGTGSVHRYLKSWFLWLDGNLGSHLPPACREKAEDVDVDADVEKPTRKSSDGVKMIL